jgi:hypothetical protein
MENGTETQHWKNMKQQLCNQGELLVLLFSDKMPPPSERKRKKTNRNTYICATVKCEGTSSRLDGARLSLGALDLASTDNLIMKIAKFDFRHNMKIKT